MEFIFLIGSIVLLFLFLFNRNSNSATDADPFSGAYFPGSQTAYQPRRGRGYERENPFTATAYAILFVLTLFAFMKMTHEEPIEKVTDFKFDKAEDYNKDLNDEDADVVVIRP